MAKIDTEKNGKDYWSELGAEERSKYSNCCRKLLYRQTIRFWKKEGGSDEIGHISVCSRCSKMAGSLVRYKDGGSFLTDELWYKMRRLPGNYMRFNIEDDGSGGHRPLGWSQAYESTLVPQDFKQAQFKDGE